MKKTQMYYIKRSRRIGFALIILSLIILAINLISDASTFEYIANGIFLVSGLLFVAISYIIETKVYNKNNAKK